jgi:hypothetical protein
VLDFLCVRHISIGLVGALWQQHQIADPIAVVLKLVLLLKLVTVLSKLVRPDMLVIVL